MDNLAHVMEEAPKKKQPIQLSDHFTIGRLLRFTSASIVMMIINSIYGVVDGFFVSNFAGKSAFAAVNFIMPVLIILGCIGNMFGTGGSALIAKTLGEGNKKKANEIFSLIVYVAFIGGVVLAVLGILSLRSVATLIGAEGQLLEESILYGRAILIALPFYILQFVFQSLLITAEKPQLGLYLSLLSGISNIALDVLLVAVFKWGLLGAAAATGLSQTFGSVCILIYFGRENSSLLRLTKCKFDKSALIKTCTNGSSELMTTVSMSVVSMLYNIQLMKYAGENGIAAYGVLMYVSMIFQAIFIGYALGIAPVISYHYGAQNHTEVKGLLKRSILLIGIFSILMFNVGEVLGRPLSNLFVGYDKKLLEMTALGFKIFSFSFFFSGFAIFGSAFFTALNDGLTSALISFLRTFVFQVGAVLFLPLLWGIEGIWLSIVVAEVMAVVVNILFLIGKRKKYHYF